MKRLLVILPAFFLIVTSQAQLPGSNPVIYSLTEENGLSDNNISCIYQDNRGFMWIGTANGLDRFDGSVFRNYRVKKGNVNELAGNYILSIAEDPTHMLWFGTKNGLTMYDPVADSFHSWHPSMTTEDIDYMSSVQVANGKLWIATYGGLLCFDPQTQQFSSFINDIVPAGDMMGKNNRVNKLLIDREQRFWLCTYNGLWRFYPNDKHFEQYISSKDVPNGEALINEIFEDHAGKIWLGFYANGIQLLDPVTKKLTNYFGYLDSWMNIGSIAESKDLHGNYMLNAGTLELDPSKKTVRNIYQPTTSADHFTLNKCYITRDNLLWWATNKGLKIIDPTKQFFHNYYLSPKELTYQSVSICENGKDIYVGAAGPDFLKLYNDSFRLLKIFHSPDLSTNQHSFALLNIIREDASHLWLCTEHGLFLFDENKGNSQSFLPKKEDSTRPPRDFINNLFIDSKGNHWVFPWRSGIWQVDKNSGKYKKMCEGITTENKEIKKFVVSSAAEDGNGNIWFGDLDEGLIFYDRQQNSFSKPLEKIIGPRFRLDNIYFEKPWIWSVVTSKVFRINTDTKKFESWNIPDEFNNQVNGFCADHLGYLWIQTNKGLLSFNETTYAFKRYTANDGLMDNVLNETIWSLHTGKILYAGKNYMTVFDPAEVTRSAAIPPVMVTDVFSQNKPVSIEISKDGEKYIRLNYTYNNFSFNWAVQNYTNPLQNQYYCKLEGVDNDWKYVGNKGQAQYASLSPGNYVFRMRGATSDGVMNEKGDYLRIFLQPPFWKTGWFIALSVLFISILIYMLYKYRLEESLKRERLRSKISTDLHDDIGSTLSSISILSDMALKETHENNAMEMVKEIRDNSVLLMEKMDDIVWSINPGNDTLENLLVRIRRFASRLFEARNIDYDISITESVRHLKLSMEYRQHIYLLLKEAINNMVKYADCTKANIHVHYEDGMLKIRVADNGKGFDRHTISYGNGLLNMQSRARMMKGRLELQSKPGEGTSITLETKIK